MMFNVKQLLFFVFVAALGFTALANANNRYVHEAVRLVVLCALILSAYGIWISEGQRRAFRVGFLIWGGIYFLIYVVVDAARFKLFTWQTSFVLRPLLNIFLPGVYERDPSGKVTGVHGTLKDAFDGIGHSLFALLFGLIGGWVTVYFYRKRQRILARRT